MRFSFATGFLVLAATLSPMLVQAGTIVSGFNCPQTMACDANDPLFPTTAQIVAAGNSCLARLGGMSIEGGYFDQGAGLDPTGCLSTRSEAVPVNAKVAVAPKCCMKQVSATLCTLHCDMVAQ